MMRSSRTVTLLLLVALGTALLIPGAHAQSAGQKRTRVRMAQSADGYVSVPTYVAQAKGYFEAEGIDVERLATAIFDAELVIYERNPTGPDQALSLGEAARALAAALARPGGSTDGE